MILLPCPWCGPRGASEFAHLGEVVARPDPQTATAKEWRDYLYFRDNPRGWVRESWYHRAGCRRYVTVWRDTASNAFAPDTGEPPAQQPGVHDGAQAGGVST